MRLLNTAREEHRPTGRSGGHDIAVIAKNREALRGEAAGRDVKYDRGQFARDLVHVRNHQQQTLTGGEGCTQRTGLQRTVQRASRATLRLHLDHGWPRAPEVRFAFAGPLIGEFAHAARGGDRVDGDDLAGFECDGGDGFTSVDGDLAMFHTGLRARGRSWLERVDAPSLAQDRYRSITSSLRAHPVTIR